MHSKEFGRWGVNLRSVCVWGAWGVCSRDAASLLVLSPWQPEPSHCSLNARVAAWWAAKRDARSCGASADVSTRSGNERREKKNLQQYKGSVRLKD